MVSEAFKGDRWIHPHLKCLDSDIATVGTRGMAWSSECKRRGQFLTLQMAAVSPVDGELLPNTAFGAPALTSISSDLTLKHQHTAQ